MKHLLQIRRQEVGRNWRKLHNEELHALHFLTQYFSGDEINEDENVWHVACAGGGEGKGWTDLVRKPEEKRSVGVAEMVILTL